MGLFVKWNTTGSVGTVQTAVRCKVLQTVRVLNMVRVFIPVSAVCCNLAEIPTCRMTSVCVCLCVGYGLHQQRVADVSN